MYRLTVRQYPTCFYVPVLLFLVLLVLAVSSLLGQWQKLDKGLDFAEFKVRYATSLGDSLVSVLRVDPALWDFRYLAARDEDSLSRRAGHWARRHSLVAVANAGMYAKDYLTHVGYVLHRGKVKSPRVLTTYKSLLALHPRRAGLPGAALLDMQCEGLRAARLNYNTLIQNIRMISCKGVNVWADKPERHSISALGQDSDGRLLFLFCQSPYSVHDFNRILLSLPISLKRAMYLEGGSPAVLYVKYGEFTRDLKGLREGGVVTRALPNVIGISRKAGE